MTIVNVKSFINSVRYALRGLKYAYKHEQNFRIQIFCGILVCALVFFFEVSRRDILLLVFVVGSVLVLELINTTFEQFLTIVEPKIQSYAQVMKDVMASAVFIVSILALVVGTMIFWPYIAKLF
jgi:undecaprenol kinase